MKDKQYNELLEQVRLLQAELEKTEKHKQINRVLYEISATVRETVDLYDLFEKIRRSLGRVIDTSTFFIALYDTVSDQVTFPFVVDIMSESYPKRCQLATTVSGTGEVLKSGKPLFLYKKEMTRFMQSPAYIMPEAIPPEVWMGVPLNVDRKCIGCLVVQHYENPEAFKEEDLDVLLTVADQVAVAIDRKKKEEALKENIERFHLAMEATSDGLWDWNIISGEVYYSPNYWHLIGYDSQADVGNVKDWASLLHPKDRDRVLENNQDCIDGLCESFAIEYRMKTSSGNWKWIMGRGKAVTRDSSGKATRLVGTHQDVTERRLAHEAIERRIVSLTRPLEDNLSVRFEDMFDLAEIQKIQDKFAKATGVSSIITDVSGNAITKGSNFRRFCRDFICKVKDCEQVCFLNDGVPEEISGTGPVIRSCVLGGLWDAGASISVGGHHIANWLIGQVRKKGFDEAYIIEYANKNDLKVDDLLAAYRELPEMSEDKFQKISQSLFSFARQLSRTAFQNIQQARFISELKEHEKKARENAEKHHAFFSSISDPIFIHPWQEEGFGKFIEVNRAACETYGYTAQEFLTMTAVNVSCKDYLREFGTKEQRSQLAENGYLYRETYHIKKNGDRFPVEVNSRVFELSGEKIIVAIVRDISERIAAQEERYLLESQLFQAQKMESVGRLAGGVAHDFNNMLSLILGHTEMAMDDVQQNTSIYEDLKEVKKAAEHSADLTRQLLAFARQQSVAPKVLDMNEGIERILNMLRRLLGENILLNWKPGSELWPIKIDPNQMDQILTNLCVNARDAIEGRGYITIETSNVYLDNDFCAKYAVTVPGDYVQLKVTDSGTGIAPEVLPFIFEPFYTTKEVGDGTGLGLSTVYGILRQNNSYISVESKEGVSTCLTLHVPRAYEKNAEEREVETISNTGRETILLVEDEPAIINMGRKMLELGGYKVLVAVHGQDALKMIEDDQVKIDILLTDVIMPGMNGKQLADRIIKKIPDLKCVYMSGYTADIIAEQGIRDDSVAFLQKPFTRQELLDKVRFVLDR